VTALAMDRRMSVPEIAREFGFAPATVRRWIATGSLPFARTPGGKFLVRPSDLEAVLNSSSRPPAELQQA
jgi:excisionase family DNA binding protein